MRTARTDFGRKVHCLFGLPFDDLTAEHAVANLCDSISEGTRCFLTTPNLNFVVGSQVDENFRNSVIESDMVLIDGAPLVWICKLLGIPICRRVAGSTVFERLRSESNLLNRKIRVFFFGGQGFVAEKACSVLNSNLDGMMCCVGSINPGFNTVSSMSTPAIIDKINCSGADLLVVSLGARKGQEWILQNLNLLHVPVVSHLGAVVNFTAGTVKRAPRFVQRLGFEWLWRVKEEPKLWSRYFGDGLALIRLMATRVLPLMWVLKAKRKTEECFSCTTVDFYVFNEVAYFKLVGPFCEKHLKDFRDILQINADQTFREIRIDLSCVCDIDSAFLGLLILIYGHQLASGGVLVLEAVPDLIRRSIFLRGGEFLLRV